MSGTELVPAVKPAMVAAAIVDGVELPDVASGEDATKSLLSSILNAEDADAVLAVFESTSWRDLLEVPVLVHGVKWRPSAFKDGPPIFAIVEVEHGDPLKSDTVTTSGRSVMAALFRLDQLGAWPQRVKLTESKRANEDGNKALQLARA